MPDDKMAKSNHDNRMKRDRDERDEMQGKSKRPKKKKNIFLVILKKLMACITTTLLSFFLIVVITGTIVATALTVYVMNFMGESTTISLAALESGSDTYFYGTQINEDGQEEEVVLKQIKADFQRIPVSIDRIPQHVRNAFVYTEDERFYVHDGVDYKRTFSAFLNMFLHFYDTDQGGSTITQQLIKNLTGDREKTPQRKIREIFSAMQLEKNYSKDEILEEYLNYISFGGATNGIQLASINYFGKSVEELTIPEAAVLAAIPKSPEYYGPFVTYYADDALTQMTVDGRANNKVRQEYVLWQMYKNGAITFDEYQEYLVTPILYTDTEEYKKLHPEVDIQQMKDEEDAYTWELDAMTFEAAKYLMEIYNIDDERDAIKKLNKGGFRVYSTIDKKMQNYVEDKFSDLNNIIAEYIVRRNVDLNNDGVYDDDECLPHIAFTALRYDGSVMATVGNWGEKKGSLVTSFANNEPRQVGSTMKPVATYGCGIETNHIHWGSIYRNVPLSNVKDDDGNPWPFNYGRARGDGSAHPIYYFLEKSFNTVPAQLVDEMTPETVFNFCTENLGMELVSDDKNYSPLALGALNRGITLQNLVNAYLPYGAKGVYNEAHVISRMEDANGNIIVDNRGGRNTRQAVSEETAWVMNRLIKNVVDNGTGTGAKLYNKVVVGKTGTTENWYDLAFIGMTRDFVSGITIGYKENNPALELSSSIHSASVWNTIIGEYANTQFLDTPADFDPVETVIQAPMCTTTGMVAGAYCPKGITGYWKSTNVFYCDGSHGYVPDPNAGDGTGGGTAVDPGTGGGAVVDPGAGGAVVDPGTGGGADPGAGGDPGWFDPGAGGDPGWVDPGTGGDPGWVDPGEGGGGGDVETW